MKIVYKYIPQLYLLFYLNFGSSTLIISNNKKLIFNLNNNLIQGMLIK